MRLYSINSGCRLLEESAIVFLKNYPVADKYGEDIGKNNSYMWREYRLEASDDISQEWKEV